MESFGSNDQLWWALGYCAFMLFLGQLIRRYPPKKINHIYGYRTTHSMRNEKTWKLANDYSSELMVRFCLYSFFFPFIFYFLLPGWNFILTVVGNSILIILILYYTEKYLREHFDEQGNPLK